MVNNIITSIINVTPLNINLISKLSSIYIQTRPWSATCHDFVVPFPAQKCLIMLQCTPKRSVFCQPYFFAFFIFLFYEYQRIYCFFLFCVYGHFGFSLPHLLLLGFVFLFSAVRKKTWKTMRWYYCSCSFLSHQYLSFTVGA